MGRSRGSNPDPKNPAREIGSFNQSLTFQASSAGRGGATPNVTTNRTYVLEANYQTGNRALYATNAFGGRGSPVATKSPNGRWQVTGALSNPDERSALQQSLNKGNFGKTLNNELQSVATGDLGSDQYNRIFNSSVAKTPEKGSSPGGGGNSPKGPGGSSSKTTPEDSETMKSAISTGVKARTQYASSSELKYPSQYDGNDYLTITMLRYVADPNLGLGKNPNATGEGEGNVLTLNPDLGLSRPSQRLAGKKNVLATISLPIPANLVDQNLVGWGNGDINALEAYGAGAASRLMQSGFGVGEQLGKEVSAAAGALRNNKDAAKTLITASLAAKIIGINDKNLLSRSTGAILNPNSELLFNGPSLRTFNFSFKMTPRHQKEAIAIRKIIRTLKQGMAPKSTASGIFLAAPNIFELEFKYVDPKIKEATAKRHPFLPVLKPCALQNLSVNYMPDGSYMTYGDGSMIAYDMTCTFAELEPIFDQDYDELEKSAEQDSLIGY